MYIDLTIHNTNKENRARITRAVEFALQELLPHCKKTITIDIFLIKGLTKKEKYQADCMLYEDENVPNYIEINIDKDLGYRRFFMTLFHELVHLKQYVTGELLDDKAGNPVWCGKVYKYDDKDDRAYWLGQPWEEEAYGKEPGLYVLWRKGERSLQRKKNRKKNRK